MASLKKRSGVYYAQWYVGTKQKRVSLAYASRCQVAALPAAAARTRGWPVLRPRRQEPLKRDVRGIHEHTEVRLERPSLELDDVEVPSAQQMTPAVQVLNRAADTPNCPA